MTTKRVQATQHHHTLNNYWMRLSMISWIIKTEVWVICRSRRLRQIIQTRGGIIITTLSGIIITTHTYLSEGEEWEQKPAVKYLKPWIKAIRKDQQSKAGKAESCNHMKAPTDCEADSGATPYKLACLGLNRWPISDVSRLIFNRPTLTLSNRF